jgi:RND family efflux transporter MFP subunit
MVDPGNLVKADEKVLTIIVSQDPMYAYFDVDDLTYMKINLLLRGAGSSSGLEKLPPVLLGLPNEKGLAHKGKIDFVDNQVDPGTGTVKMRGVFANKDGLITPGLFVRISVPLGDPHKALLITDRAIDTDQGEKVVYVVNKDNIVEKREVQLGGLHDGLREIQSGARPGERIIVDGIQRVRGGVPANPKIEKTS